MGVDSAMWACSGRATRTLLQCIDWRHCDVSACRMDKLARSRDVRMNLTSDAEARLGATAHACCYGSELRRVEKAFQGM